jgi:hypothetical protein
VATSKKPTGKPEGARKAASSKKIEDAVVVDEKKPAKPVRNTGATSPVRKTGTPPETGTGKPDTPKKKSGFLPLVFGGLIAGGIGFGAATYYYMQQPVIDPDTITVLAARIGAQEQQINGFDGVVSTLTTRIEEETGYDDLATMLEGLKAATSAADDLLADKLAGIVNTVTAIDARLTTLEKRPVSQAGGVTPEAAAAYERELNAMRKLLETQKAEIGQMADEAAARIEGAEQKAASLEDRAGAKARAATVRTAMSRVQAAMESGNPFSSALTELTSEGVAVPAGLTGDGVPTLAALQDSFADAARAGLDASVKAVAGDGAMDKLSAFFKSQVGVRSLEPREGDDPDAVLSRAEAAVRSGNLSTALALVAMLPDVGQAAMAGWVDMASQRQSAEAAVAQLVQNLNGN